MSFIVIEKTTSQVDAALNDRLLLTREAYWTAQLCKRNPHNLFEIVKTGHKETASSLSQRNFAVKQYPAEIIDYSVNKAPTQTMEELRRVRKQATENNILRLVTTYNPNNPQVFQLVRKTLPMLNQDSSLKSSMRKTKVIHSQRQLRNLKRMLTTPISPDKMTLIRKLTFVKQNVAEHPTI